MFYKLIITFCYIFLHFWAVFRGLTNHISWYTIRPYRGYQGLGLKGLGFDITKPLHKSAPIPRFPPLSSTIGMTFFYQ
jgi:hypothetical protein